ncbi:MAG: FAD-linked oxidase C-terminal domain-containing protein, partial [Saprospiraceae bacterium]
EIMAKGNAAIKEICGGGIMTCRFTHLYPDGPAPYYTIVAKGQTNKEIEQWDTIKKIVSKAIIDFGGTITHHHAVGKDHQPYYKQQSSKIFATTLSAVKNTIDPKWILNPDVLIER